MDNSSGVGVLDKAVALLDALERSPLTLAGLVAATGLARPTAYRLAVALQGHGWVGRDADGRFHLGERLAELGAGARPGPVEVLRRAEHVLPRLRDSTGESAQLYLRRGDSRLCVAAAEPPAGLRDTVPPGSRLPMTAGSAAQVLLAWSDPGQDAQLLASAAFTVRRLAVVRRQGWADSVGEREAGVASVSAPVRDPGGQVVAAVSVSGPTERLGRSPGRRHAEAVLAAAALLSG